LDKLTESCTDLRNEMQSMLIQHKEQIEIIEFGQKQKKENDKEIILGLLRQLELYYFLYLYLESYINIMYR